MAVGRISGPLLKANLVRNGIDLAFDTDLLYLDVNSKFIGVNKKRPQTELDVNGTTRSTNVTVTNSLTNNQINITGNTISSANGVINLTGAGGDPVVYNNTLEIGNVRINNNTVSSISANSDLYLEANGTGQVKFNSDVNVTGNVHATGNITADGDIVLGNDPTDTVTIGADVASNISPDLDLTYNLGAPLKRWNNLYSGSVRADTVTTDLLKIPVGDTASRPTPAQAGYVRFNNELERFEGYDGANWISLNGVADVDSNTYVLAEATPGANDNQIRFFVAGNQIAVMDSTKLQTARVDAGNIRITGNTISSSNPNGNITLTPDGVGVVRTGNFSIAGSTIRNVISNGVSTLGGTGGGYVEFSGSGAVVIPSGNTLGRPGANVALGMMRYNIENEQVEIYNGISWVSSAGSGGTVTVNDAQDIAIKIVLSIG